jgi:DNA polymerase/3'-5' exonuclease PolX
MRRLAIALGYMLNEYHLLDENNKPMKVTSEQDVFDILGMEYVTPDKR